MYQKGIKRILDFILALSGLIVLSPIFIFYVFGLSLIVKDQFCLNKKE